ncbi:MAG: hypothetical protein VW405_00690 [Rhodospirillaceae bacterium]
MAEIDFQSETWRALQEQAAERIESYRTRLEKEGLSLEETERLRGRIAELRALLALAKPKPQFPLSRAPY